MEPTYISNPKVGRAQIPYMNEQRHGEEIFVVFFSAFRLESASTAATDTISS